MSAESLKAFTEKVAADTDLTERAKSISPNDFPAIIAFAQELGYEVTEQDLTSNNQIADDVLDTIAGGVNPTIRKIQNFFAPITSDAAGGGW